MLKPRKPRPEGGAGALKPRQEESPRPASPPARPEGFEGEELLSEELDGAGEGKPMPDHDDEL